MVANSDSTSSSDESDKHPIPHKHPRRRSSYNYLHSGGMVTFTPKKGYPFDLFVVDVKKERDQGNGHRNSPCFSLLQGVQ